MPLDDLLTWNQPRFPNLTADSQVDKNVIIIYHQRVGDGANHAASRPSTSGQPGQQPSPSPSPPALPSPPCSPPGGLSGFAKLKGAVKAGGGAIGVDDDTPAISASNIDFRFGEKAVLSNLDLEVRHLANRSFGHLFASLWLSL